MTFTPKPPRCKWCKVRTDKVGRLLHEECIEPWLEKQRAKKAAKERAEKKVKARIERAEFRKRKEAIKKRTEWEDECRRIVQAIARVRDRNDGCISCHLPATWDGQWHGSHFRSQGACSVLQFHLWNIHKSCSSCNRDKGGNILGYEPRLIAKIGAERVEWLKCQNGIFKPPIDYYKRFKAVMGKKLRRMQKRLENA